MRGAKIKGTISILFVIILILNVPITSTGTIQQEDAISSDVKLYSHLNQNDKLNHDLSPLPLDENQELQYVNLLYLKTSSTGEKYDLQIDGSKNALFELWASSDRYAAFELDISLSYNNQTLLAGSTVSRSVDTTPVKIETSLEFLDEEIHIREEHDLYLKLDFSWPPGFMPTNIIVHSGPDYPSGLTLTIKDPIRVELQITDKAEAQELHVFAVMTTPFGGENIESYELRIEGSTPETELDVAIAEYPPSMGSRDLIWYYSRDDPKPGYYTIHLNATTRQGVNGEDTYVFHLEDKDENQELDLILFYFFILFIIIIICAGIFLFYKKREKKNKKEN